MAAFEPQRALVLGHIKDTYADLTAGRARSNWAFILQPVGQDSTRLLVRCRGNSLMTRLQGLIQLVMQRKMMLARLSPQEERILGLVADGRTNGQIAAELGLAEKTVKNYVSAILSKLEVARRAEAAASLARHTSPPGS